MQNPTPRKALLMLNTGTVVGFVGFCEQVWEEIFRDLLWEDETQREVVVESLKADCEIRTGRPPDL
jgi:hypothetical protein